MSFTRTNLKPYTKGDQTLEAPSEKADMIEILDITRPKKVISKGVRPGRPSLSSSKRALMPIDPPYMPFHRHMNRLVSPRRESTALPSIAEEAEAFRSTPFYGTQSTKTASSLPTRPDTENADLPSLETLKLSDCVPPAPSKANKPWTTPHVEHRRYRRKLLGLTWLPKGFVGR
jgi:hypothetical protein